MRLLVAHGSQARDQKQDLIWTAVVGNQKAKMRVSFTGLLQGGEKEAPPCKGNCWLSLSAHAFAVQCCLTDTSLGVAAVLLQAIKENRQARVGIITLILYQ